MSASSRATTFSFPVPVFLLIRQKKTIDRYLLPENEVILRRVHLIFYQESCETFIIIISQFILSILNHTFKLGIESLLKFKTKREKIFSNVLWISFTLFRIPSNKMLHEFSFFLFPQHT